MRICHITPLPPIKSGISHYSMEMISHLKDLNVDGFAVSSGNDCQGIEVIKFDALKLGSIIFEIHKRKPDVIHYQLGGSYKNYFVTACKIVLKNISIPKVITVHDLPFTSLLWLNKVERMRRCFWQAFVKEFEKEICNKSDLIMVHSNYAKDLLKEYYEVNGNKVEVIPHGIESNLTISAKQAREKLNLPEGGLTILSGGLIYKNKGFGDVLLAFSNINVNALLVIVGDGPFLNNLKRSAKELGITNKVRFTGRLSRSVLRDYFVACDFVVLAKKYSFGETSGILANARGFGKPIITTDIGSNKELVINNVNGFLVKVGDIDSLVYYMKLMAEKHELRIKMGKNSFEMAESSEWKNVCKKIKKVYEKVTPRFDTFGLQRKQFHK